MDERTFPRLYNQWIAIWNGEDFDLEDIFLPEVIVHQSPHEKHGIEAVREMVEQGLAPFDPAFITIEVEPVFDDHMLAARWRFHGTYQGGIPDVSAPPGKAILFGGTDLWRFSDGKVSDYWVSSDSLWLMDQLNS